MEEPDRSRADTPPRPTRRVRDRDVGELADRLRFALLFALAMAIPLTALGALMLGSRLPLPVLIVTLVVALFATAWWGYPILGVLSQGFTRMLIAQGGDPVQPTHSEQEALVAAGRISDAIDSFRARLVAFPDDVEARIRLAALLAGHGAPEEARRHYLDARARATSAPARLRIATGLADLHRAAGRDAALRDELARCAREFAGTAAGEHARRELRQVVAAEAAARRDSAAPGGDAG